MTLPIQPTKRRNPQRGNRAGTTISLNWAVYDRLNEVATKHNASMAQTINALLDMYENNRSTTGEADSCR